MINNADSDDMENRDLRSRFAKLRAEDGSETPPFALPAARNEEYRRRPFAGRLVAATACTLLIAVAVLWVSISRRESVRPGQPVASLTGWRAPTDFLLQTPGREFLRTIPAIGTSGSYSKTATLTQKRTGRKQIVH